jgi:hypothetical protein
MVDNENGKTAGRLEEWQKGVDEKLLHILITLDEAFKPEGFCARSREKLGNVNASVKIQWFLLAGIIIAIITQALKK